METQIIEKFVDNNACIEADESFKMPSLLMVVDELHIGAEAKSDTFPKQLEAESIRLLYNETIREINSKITAELLSFRFSKVENISGEINAKTFDIQDSLLRKILKTIVVTRKMKANDSVLLCSDNPVQIAELEICNKFDLQGYGLSEDENPLILNGSLTLANILKWEAPYVKGVHIKKDLTFSKCGTVKAEYLKGIKSVGGDIILEKTKIIGDISHVDLKGQIKPCLFSGIIEK